MGRLVDYFVTSRISLQDATENGTEHQNQIKFNRPGAESTDTPVVDLCVLFDTERVPDGYSPLEVTPYGSDGDCNSDAIVGKSVFVCVQYAGSLGSEGKLPIEDINVVYLSEEKIPPGYTLIEKSASGMYPANLNYGGRKVFLAIKRVPSVVDIKERYNSLTPVVDLCIINTSKQEQPPLGYELIPKSTNHGNWTGSRMMLCLKRASGLGLLDTSLFSKTEKFPYNDYPDFPCPKEIGWFCSPGGMVLQRRHKTNEPLPTAFSFLLTQKDGKKVHGTCLTFYERIDDSTLNILEQMFDKHIEQLHSVFPDNFILNRIRRSRQNTNKKLPKRTESLISASTIDTTLEEDLEDQDQINGIKEPTSPSSCHPLTEEVNEHWHPSFNTEMEIYVPICICLLSHYPFYAAFKEFLMMIYQVSISKSDIPIERFIGQILTELPVPKPGGPGFILRFGSGHSAVLPIKFVLPAERGLPLCYVNFEVPFQFLSVENFVTLFTLVLLEKKIVLHSRYRSVLYQIAEVVRTLLFPFDWQFIYVPVCPRSMIGIVEAPMNFLIGLDSSWLQDMSLPPDVWEVDLDNNEINLYGKRQAVETSNGRRQKMVLRVIANPDSHMIQMPPKTHSRFIRKLKESLKRFSTFNSEMPPGGNEMQQNPDLAYAMKSMIGLGHGSIEELKNATREAALIVMIDLIGTYRDYLLPLHAPNPDSAGDRLPKLFDAESFLNAAPKIDRSFRESLCHTLAFQKFLEERTYGSKAKLSQKLMFFDAIIDAAADIERRNNTGAASFVKSKSVSPSTKTLSRRTESEMILPPVEKDKNIRRTESVVSPPTKTLTGHNSSHALWNSFRMPRKLSRQKGTTNGNEIFEPLLLDLIIGDSNADLEHDDKESLPKVFDAGVSNAQVTNHMLRNGHKPVLYQYDSFPVFQRDLFGECADRMGPDDNDHSVRERSLTSELVLSPLNSDAKYYRPRSSSFSSKKFSANNVGVEKQEISLNWNSYDLFSTRGSKHKFSRKNSSTEELAESGIRTLEEIHYTQLRRGKMVEAMHLSRNTVVQVYGSWFCCLPRWIIYFNRPLRLASIGLDVIKRSPEITQDEACYRSLIVACSLCGPSFVRDNERIFFQLMEASGIKPNALTYAYHSNAVSIKSSPQTTFSALQKWRKLSTLLKICRYFKHSKLLEPIQHTRGGMQYQVCAIWSQIQCCNCQRPILDHDIMAAWSSDENQLMILCPYCGFSLVPRLTYRIMHVSQSNSEVIVEEGHCEYMSPFFLRKSIETHRSTLIRERSPNFWNMLWYCERLNLFNPAKPFTVVCGWEESGTTRKALDLLNLGDDVRASTITKLELRATEGEATILTLWGNLNAEKQIQDAISMSLGEERLSVCQDDTPILVVAKLYNLIKAREFAQAIVMFLSARRLAGNKPGWDLFFSNMFLEFQAIGYFMYKSKYVDYLWRMDGDYVNTLKRISGIDRELSTFVRTDDAGPSLMAHHFRQCFDVLYP